MYRQTDIELVRKNIDTIKDDAMRKKLNTLEPTLKSLITLGNLI